MISPSFTDVRIHQCWITVLCLKAILIHVLYFNFSALSLSSHQKKTDSSVRLYVISAPHNVAAVRGAETNSAVFKADEGCKFQFDTFFFTLYILGRKWHAVFLKTRKWSKLCPAAKSFESHALWTGCFWRPIYLKAACVTFERCVRRSNLYFRASRSYTLVSHFRRKPH